MTGLKLWRRVAAGPLATFALFACGEGATAACLSDTDIEQAVGSSVRAGAAIINTRALPDLPLCSGLTLAQQIQRIRAAAFPEPAAAPQVDDPVPDLPPPAAIAPAAFTAPLEIPRRVSTPRVAQRPVRARAAAPRAAAPRRRAASGFFASCSAARAAGAAPIRRGEPAYSRRLDRDGDGIACE